MRALILLALAPLMIASCKAKCHDPLHVTENDDAITAEEKAEEEKALAKQPNLCAELKTPEVHVGTRISVRAGDKTHAVARIPDLPKEHMRLVEGLRTRLRSYKDHWRALHPTDEFDGRAKIIIEPPGVNPVRGVSILMTTLGAGFKVDSLRVLDTALDNVDFWIQKPPLPDGKFETYQSLCVDLVGGQYALRFDPELPGAPSDPVSVAALPDAIAKACAGKTTCADVLAVEEPASHDFVQHVKTAQTALGASPFAAKKPRLYLRTHAPQFTSALGVPDSSKLPCVKQP